MSSNYPHPPPHSASASKQRQSKRTNNNNDDTTANNSNGGSEIEVPSLANISIGASASSDTSNTTEEFDWFGALAGSNFFEDSDTTSNNNNSAAADNNSAPVDNSSSSSNDDNNDNINDIQAAFRAAEAAGATLTMHDPSQSSSTAYFITEDRHEVGLKATIIGAIFGRYVTNSEGEPIDMLQYYFSSRVVHGQPSAGNSATFRTNGCYHRTANGDIPPESYYYHCQDSEMTEIVSYNGVDLTVPSGYVLSCHNSDTLPLKTDNELLNQWFAQKNKKAYTLYVEENFEEDSSEEESVSGEESGEEESSGEESGEEGSSGEESGEEGSVSRGEDVSSKESIAKKRIVLAVVPYASVITSVMAACRPPMSDPVFRNCQYLDDDNNWKSVDVKFARFKEEDGHIGLVTKLGAKILPRPFLVQSTYTKSINKLNTLGDRAKESATYVS